MNSQTVMSSESIITTEYTEFIETRTGEVGRMGILSFVLKLS